MEEEDVRGYVEHRLGVAGSEGSIFAADAIPILAARSGGVPRRVNTLATQALFVAAMRKLTAIDAELVQDVADDQE
jgi:type II secretory pathway predicted ATPase ExeA